MTLATSDEARAVKVALPKDTDLWSVIFQTVGRVEIFKHLSNQVARDVADAVCAALGHDKWTEETPAFCGPDAELLQAVKNLLTWTPEGGYAEAFGEFALKDDDSRFYFGAETPEEYNEMLGRRQYEDEKGRKRWTEPMPFLSQQITYPVLGGKHDGRSIMSRVEALRRIVGLKEDDGE